MVVSLDGLLERLGVRYQCLVLMVLSSWLTQVSLHHHLHHHYLTTPAHRCKLPQEWKEEESLPAVLVSGPSTNTREHKRSRDQITAGYSSCLMLKDPKAHRRGTQSCIFGYVFTVRHEEWSVVAEWGLVCGRSWIKEWVVMTYLIGLVVGGIIFGILADRFGRRNLLVVSVVSVSCIGVALHFVRRLIVFLGLRFLQAVFVQGIYVTAWTLLGELLPPRWRCRALVAGAMTRPLGMALGTAVGLTVQHWRGLQLTAALPLLLSLLYYWMVPESLRWLLTRGKMRRAKQVAGQLARHNLLTLPPTAHAQMDHLAAHVYVDLAWESLITLFRTPRLRAHILVTMFMWLAVSLADNGFRKELRVTEDVEGLEEWQLTLLGGQGHLGAALEAGVEAGAVVFSAVLTTLLYRRAFLVAALLLSAALAIAVACVLQLVNEAWMDVTSLATALRFVGVFTVGCARLGLGVVTVEVTPTTSRASAVGLCAAQAAIGEILASFMTVMAKMTYPSVPWLVSAGGCLLAAILTLVLPETSGTTLPDVVDEAEVVGLAISGQVIKSCYAKYGRTPYWTELDGEASGENHQGSHCHNKPRRYTKRSEASFFSTTEEHNEVEIKSRDRPPSSPASHESSDSPSSLMSLVDVSRVNGNNSDTSDSSDNDVHTVMGRTNPNTEESPKTSESSHLKAIKIHQRPLPAIPDEANPLPSGQKDETNDSKDQNKNKEASPEATAFYEGSVENDFSMSVFSLKFRHIKRPISPTERKAKTDLHYTSSFSSTCTYRPRKTLIQECVSRHSFQDDESNSCSSSQCGRDSESQCGRDSEEGNADTIEPLQSVSKEIYEDNDKEKEKEQLTDAQKYSKSRNTPHNLKLLYSSKTCTHKSKTTLAETEETLPSTFMHPSREQTSSNLNPEQSPEPKPQKRRYLPVTRLSKCDALPDTLYSRKGKALSKTHSARCSLRATDTGSGGQRREAGEPVFKAATGEWGTGKAEREEKATILRRINQIQSAMSGGKSKAAGKDATHNVDEIKTDERLV